VRGAKNYKEAYDYYNKVLELNQFIEQIGRKNNWKTIVQNASKK
jgi:hypothetical protein